MPCTAKGRLVFEKPTVSGGKKPMHNTLVKLIDDDLGPDTVLATAETDKNGEFEFKYDPRDAGSFDTPDLKVEVFLPEVRYSKKTEKAVISYIPVKGYQPKVFCNVKGDHHFGDIVVPCWEYAPEAVSFTPRLLIDDSHVMAQEQRRGRQAMTVEAGIKTAVALFVPPKNKTMKMDDEVPGTSRSDEYFVDFLLNGFNPCVLKKEATGVDGAAPRYYVSFKWDGIAQDGVHFAPNTTAYLTKDGDSFVLAGVEVTKRNGFLTRSARAGVEKPVLYTKEGCKPEMWDRVKRLWRVNAFLFGEAVTHLGNTHLNVEQYIVPMQRNIRKNPILQILAPHTYGTVAINNGADNILTGGAGLVVSVSAATSNSVAVVVRNGFVGVNWYGWKPREAVCDAHRFAKSQKLFWDVVTKHVDMFFEENIDTIVEHWHEIARFSEELVENSVPYTNQEGTDDVDPSEVNLSTHPHPMRANGTRSSVSPVTLVDTLDNDNKKENIENLKQLCRYIIHTATFVHSWVNDSQYDVGGDPDFATLGVDYDITDLAKSAAESVSDDSRRKHTLTTYILTQLKYGYLIKDEDSDVPPNLKKILNSERHAFEGLGLDINVIRSCINT
eukprot:TRINITY_DN20821_c0_g1_i1.p1 TRINITY_DN20821_c0_g1~~TRINITY_DN20821_c0_g1_i1.p1  ORF type:complete len:610 (+),score=118.46 TRINITY_DN20821_c0_g1_i1:51-1880(+)